MERIRSLTRYQKAILLWVLAMVVVFSILYPMTIAREGFLYRDAILVPTQERDAVVYAGELQGEAAKFTVYADKTVLFQYGDRTYGPYTAAEDPTAIPKGHEMADKMTGIELRQGEEILFRGGIACHGTTRFLYAEDGSLESVYGLEATSNGLVLDIDGPQTDFPAPSADTILTLMSGPELTHRGEGFAWLGGMLFCLTTVLSLLFADELFRLHLSFRIRNSEQAEPSEWEIASRYICWTVLSIAAMALFVLGLR